MLNFRNSDLIVKKSSYRDSLNDFFIESILKKKDKYANTKKLHVLLQFFC